MIETKIAASAATSTGLFYAITGSADMITLLAVGTLASVLSFFYDWSRKNKPPRPMGLIELTAILKHAIYGAAMVVFVFFALASVDLYYIKLPAAAHGLIAVLCAYGSVAIVCGILPMLKSFLQRILQGVKP